MELTVPQDVLQFLPLALVAVVLAVALLRPRRRRKPAHGRRRPAARPILVDGSNVMYWRDDIPDIATVLAVVNHLRTEGFAPGVVFDANAGHLLFDRYRHDHYFANQLGLKESHVMVVPKGTQADPFLLDAARDMGAWVVTNDKFRDWVDDYPEIAGGAGLIPGRIVNGEVKLDMRRAGSVTADG